MRTRARGWRLPGAALIVVLAAAPPGQADWLHPNKNAARVNPEALFGYYPTNWTPWPAPPIGDLASPANGAAPEQMPPAGEVKSPREKAPVIAASARKTKAKGRPTVFAEPALRAPEAVPLTEERPTVRSPYNPRDTVPR
jgi:hypothetical protein